MTDPLDKVCTVYLDHQCPWIPCSVERIARAWLSCSFNVILTCYNHYVMGAQFYPKDRIVPLTSGGHEHAWDSSGKSYWIPTLPHQGVEALCLLLYSLV